MPIYEYVCKECANHFEVFSTSAAAASSQVVKCKKCGGVDVKKTVSASSFKMAGGSAVSGGPLTGCSAPSGFK
ncbi:MAG: zinc ribbon domain-containing protein [Desulfobulbaceae bacterium]|nr:zinc ribbon domain-containing protein [Desulfobulbaceae bacterium]